MLQKGSHRVQPSFRHLLPKPPLLRRKHLSLKGCPTSLYLRYLLVMEVMLFDTTLQRPLLSAHHSRPIPATSVQQH
ncbi:hypothetical protein CC2G_003676 [Coprinopsis cinerea AmutBmut pab1-1]|nr:hypothetical protein CC2G_003676 [Coprinopsis cinerea AmutBmut pab1-1]